MLPTGHSCQAATQDTMGFISRPYSYNTGALVPFPHMKQGIPILCFLTGYRDSCPPSSQDTGNPVPLPHRIQGFLFPFLTGYRDSCPPSSQDTGIPVPLPHRIQGFLSPFLTGYKDSRPASGLGPGVPVFFLAGYSSTCPFLAAYRVSSPHSSQDTRILYFSRL